MQLGSKENDEQRFNHYINKSFKKTASLLANSCKAVSYITFLTHISNDLFAGLRGHFTFVTINFKFLMDDENSDNYNTNIHYYTQKWQQIFEIQRWH